MRKITIIGVFIMLFSLVSACEEIHHLKHDRAEVECVYIEHTVDGNRVKKDIEDELISDFLVDLGKIDFRSYPDRFINSRKTDEIIEIKFVNGNTLRINNKEVGKYTNDALIERRYIECSIDDFMGLIEKYLRNV